MPCTIRVRDGFLVYRLRYRGLPGGAYESQERTGLRDTPKNRQKLEARAPVMSDEMRAGSFDYVRWFPRGAKAVHTIEAPKPERVMATLGEYADIVTGGGQDFVRVYSEAVYGIPEQVVGTAGGTKCGYAKDGRPMLT